MWNFFYFNCIYLIVINITCSYQSNETRVKELNDLEKEKSDLLKQIHVAIDESVSLLRKENTTQNVEGIKYMLELKHQIQIPNDFNAENATLIEDPNSVLEHRRKMMNPKFTALIQRQLNLGGSHLDDDFNVNKLFNKQISKEQLNKLMQSRLAMQKRLDEWILQREIEKEKKRNRYLANKRLVQAGLLEKCPRFGYDSKKKKSRRNYKSNIGSDEKPKKVKQKSRKTKYPCCRKCCKKSYMGCL